MTDDATPAKVRLTDGLDVLVARLLACAENPMWNDHAEVPKKLCAAAAHALQEAVDLAGHYMAQRDEARNALELIAAPMRPDGTWSRDREACRQIAAEALGKYED